MQVRFALVNGFAAMEPVNSAGVPKQSVVQKSLDWLLSVQSRNGGIDMKQGWVQKAGRWLEAHQNKDGGWGESCASYLDPTANGSGETTASQTAWALIGLCAFPELNRTKIDRGIDCLLDRQRPDGTWDEDLQTGTGFPGVLYLRYDYYWIYWPLRALAIYASCLKSLESQNPERSQRPQSSRQKNLARGRKERTG